MLQLSKPTAERDNRGQEQIHSAQEDLRSNDVEHLLEQDVDAPVTEDCYPSDSETEPEPLLQKEALGSRNYPGRNRCPPNILCYDHRGIPSYHPISTLTTQVRTAAVSGYSPWLPVTPYKTSAMHNYR